MGVDGQAAVVDPTRRARSGAATRGPLRSSLFLVPWVVMFGVVALDGSRSAIAREAELEPKLRQAWAWQAQRGGLPDVGEASGVPKNDLAVAFLGQRDKLTYLGVHGRSLRGANLVLEVDAEASSNLNMEEAELQACVIVQRWEPASPMAWDQKPLTDCDGAAPGKYHKRTKTFSFDLTRLARALSSAAVFGLSIEPVEQPERPFQIAFKGGRSVKIKEPSAPRSETEGGQPKTSTRSSGRGGDGTGGAAFPTSSSEPPPIDVGPVSQPEEQSLQTVPSPPEAAPPISAAPSAAEADLVSFAWVYAALAGLAACPLGTRMVAYALPPKRKHR